MAEQSTNVVRFYRHWLQNNHESEAAGRPVGEEFDYVEIIGLGQSKTVVKRKATVKDQIEYSREWDLYQRGMEQVAKGTPLREWPVMTQAEILRLNSYGVHTIETVTALSDAGLQTIGPGARQLQLRAKAFLEEDAPKAATANLRVANAEQRTEIEALQAKVSQLEAENAELREAKDTETPSTPDPRMDQLEAQLAELTAAQEAKPKRGPGRPKVKAT